MTSAREILTQIWSSFRKNGIAEDLFIIQYIADLLDGTQATEEEVRVSSPVKLSPYFRSDIVHLLEEAVRLTGSKAKLFDQYILFNLPKIIAGGRYPTPRHLVACMHRLAQVEPEHSLADFACGSGGFLVSQASDAGNSGGKRVGVEISSDWARLARVNAKLHGVEAEVLSENALMFSSHVHYDRILMNPPSGESMDPSLVQAFATKKVGVRSEAVLTNLALDRLAPDGKAAIMISPRVLFAKGAESTLRQRVVDDFHLEAVVELPRDALQPYINVQSYILLVCHHSPPQTASTWFFRVEEDGYPAGRARDLTEPPRGPSDLPFMEAVFGGRGKKSAESSFLIVEMVHDNQGERLGLIVRTLASARLVSLLELREKHGHWLVATVKLAGENSASGSTQWLSLETGRFTSVENPDGLLKSGSSESLLQEGKGIVAAAITLQDMRLLGVAIERETVRLSYDFRMNEYLAHPEQKAMDASPAEILAQVRASQQRLSKLLDDLFSQLEIPPITEQQFPPPLLQSGAGPFGTLSELQLKVWNRIIEKTQHWTEGTSEYEVALHFTANEVDPSGGEASPSTRATLALLERMGLIVAVTLSPPPRAEPAVVYRRATQQDLWELT